MRVMNHLTQSLIESLTQLLKKPGQDTLKSLEICAPVLIDELQQIKDNALDRRDLMPLIQTALNEWLQQHPQPEGAVEDLIDALRRQALAPAPKGAGE